jgi:hypothetical protein
MSETLSYQDPVQEGLNADEQQSLEVGQQMQEEADSLLAGKYQNAEQLEKAYLELQQKLGEGPQDEAEEEGEEAEEEGEEAEEEEQSEEEESERPELTDQDIDFLHGMAGGKEGYNNVVTWAASNLDPNEVKLYDQVMDNGDPASVFFAVKSLVSSYNDANGVDGNLITGKSPAASTANTFNSQQELVAAMNDPRYDNDPAYRANVMRQLENSELGFS